MEQMIFDNYFHVSFYYNQQFLSILTSVNRQIIEPFHREYHRSILWLNLILSSSTLMRLMMSTVLLLDPRIRCTLFIYVRIGRAVLTVSSFSQCALGAKSLYDLIFTFYDIHIILFSIASERFVPKISNLPSFHRAGVIFRPSA